MKSIFLRSVMVSLCTLCLSAHANWRLVGDQSSVNFVSTKNQNISEIHQFTSLKGKFDPQGKLIIEIGLASIDSGIEIRDTRMKEKLFVVDKFPTAKLAAQLPDSVLNLAKGNTISVSVPAKLSIMGITQPITTHVQVTRNSDNGFVATSIQPILISATDYGLVGGVEVLQKIAGLSAISLSVPVNFNVVFTAQ